MKLLLAFALSVASAWLLRIDIHLGFVRICVGSSAASASAILVYQFVSRER